MPRITALTRAALLGACVSIYAAGARADAVEDFYKGKLLTFIVGGPAGGVFDLYARTLTRHLSRYVPGQPNAIVQNMPGAGSTAAMNHVYNVAPQDGVTIGFVSGSAPFQPLMGIEQAKFDAKKAYWLGSPSSDVGLFVVWHTSAAKSFADTQARQTIVGGSGPQGTSGFYAKVLNDVFKAKLKIVYGYLDPPQALLAMQREEIEGSASVSWNQLQSTFGTLVQDKKIRVLLQYGAKPVPGLTGVPFAGDLPLAKEEAQLFNAAIAQLGIGTSLLMGPGVPADRVGAIRKAIAETFRDKDFLDDAKKQSLDVAPVTGEETEAAIASAYGLSGAMVDRLRTLYNAQ